MRNWNYISTSIFCSLSKLRAYLWGIETSIFYPFFCFYCHVASLPMRNWNTCSRFMFIPLTKCCEPTYEELKRMSLVSCLCINELRAYLWGIETLPPFSLISFLIILLRAYLWGIETRKQKDFFHDLRKLRAYLWGIETLWYCLTVGGFTMLRAYLWGIETQDWFYLLRVSL